MAVWTDRQHAVAAPSAVSTTYLDDLNTVVDSPADTQASIAESERFDILTGQRVNAGKTVAWATSPEC
eukprot:6737107-Alexandrium_andersonii.AAC.1